MRHSVTARRIRYQMHPAHRLQTNVGPIKAVDTPT